MDFSCTHLAAAASGTRWCARYSRETDLTGCCLCTDWRLAGQSYRVQANPIAVATTRPPQYALFDRYDQPAGLTNAFLGATAFLVGGGPSLKELNLEDLRRRGCCIIGTNNNPGALPAGLRPHIWVHSDPPRKFHDSIWRDPSVWKFSPRKLWNRTGTRFKQGKWEDNRMQFRGKGGRLESRDDVIARTMPGVFGFDRNHNFDPPQFLSEPTVSNGCSRTTPSYQTGPWPGTINTMFCAVKIAYILGFRKLFLLGFDFRMKAAQPYAMGQGKSPGGCKSTNSAFADICLMFSALQPHFLAAGFEVFNATHESRLWSFPFISYADAIDAASGSFEQLLDCRGWYDQQPELEAPED